MYGECDKDHYSEGDLLRFRENVCVCMSLSLSESTDLNASLTDRYLIFLLFAFSERSTSFISDINVRHKVMFVSVVKYKVMLVS